MKAITPDLEYLSTRQSAKVLQVSLGTVQKMVELGELIAWKTRGGHRRILVSSLEQQLQRRKRAMRQKTTQKCIAMGIFRRIENSHELMESIQFWQLKVDMETKQRAFDYEKSHPGRHVLFSPMVNKRTPLIVVLDAKTAQVVDLI